MKILNMSLVALLVASLVAWPLDAQSQVTCQTSGCTTFQNALQNGTLSMSIINSAAQSWAAVLNAEQNNTLTTTELSEAKANMQTLFNYLNSEGWTDYMNQVLASVRSTLTSSGITPTTSQVTATYNSLKAQGAAVTQIQVQQFLTVTPSQAEQMYGELDQMGGWSGEETQTVQSVANVINSSGGGRPIGPQPQPPEQTLLHPRVGTHSLLKSAVGHPGIARLVLVGLCEVASFVYGVFGSGAEAAGFLGVELFIPGVGTAVAIIGLGIAALSLSGVC